MVIITKEILSSVVAFFQKNMASFLTGGFMVTTFGIIWDNHRGRTQAVQCLDAKFYKAKKDIDRQRESQNARSEHLGLRLDALNARLDGLFGPRPGIASDDGAGAGASPNGKK